MKKLNIVVSGILVFLLFSCSTDSNTNTIPPPTVNAKLLRQMSDSDGYWSKFFYNDNNELTLITRTSNQIDLDSTYLEYDEGVLIRSLQRKYEPVTGIVNIEFNYNTFNSTNANGTYKTYLDDGTILQDLTFEHSYLNNLIKTIKFFNLDGTLSEERTYNHDVVGNLTSLRQIWYNSDGTIDTDRQATFSEWDTNGFRTKSLFYWNYKIDDLPNIFLSNNNCLNRIEEGETYNYSFEYDDDGNVTRYNSLNDQKFVTLEYYE
ncbi:hypothetical protein [uncultured Winogradskyella sp.]|uniref:hypothetical protein n=1 Tax=uncultured Winogradskyella sp. TaxID=395353 RepID=UPI00261E1FC0|nr:hypothetical protein [uncultured Winogradskyella sp.]